MASRTSANQNHPSSRPGTVLKEDSKFNENAFALLMPVASRMAKSPTSCGISCAITASAVATLSNHAIAGATTDTYTIPVNSASNSGAVPGDQGFNLKVDFN